MVILNEKQRQAVDHEEGPCCVVAGAGSGKTRVLTERISRLVKKGVAANRILAVTFTKKATEEMIERLSLSLPWMGTFHKVCFLILRKEKAYINAMKIMTSSQRKSVMRQVLGPKTDDFEGMNWDTDCKTCLQFVSHQKNKLKRYDSLTALEQFQMTEDQEVFWVMYQKYEEVKKVHNYIDFDDMLLWCYELFKAESDVLKKYQGYFDYLLVDEYQDTNVAQNELVKFLGKPHGNVMVVGDERQSIYGFRGSKVDLFVNFKREWKNCREILLETNYRSTQNIVDLSNRLINAGVFRYRGLCSAAKGEGLEPTIVGYDNEEEEAYGILSEIKSIQAEGTPLEEIAVLYRLNAQSRAIEDVLVRENIPYLVYGGLGFYGRKEVKDILAYVALSQDVSNNEAVRRVFNVPNRYLGKVFLGDAEQYAKQNKISLFEAMQRCEGFKDKRWRKAREFVHLVKKIQICKDVSPSRMIALILRETKYLEWLEETETEIDGDDEREDNIRTLIMAGERFLYTKELLNHANMVEKAAVSKDEKVKGKVRLMTVHGAKGLEFENVFLIGLSQGILPYKLCIQLDRFGKVDLRSVEEERRVCYVGMTRPRMRLHLSWLRSWLEESMEMSMFLEDVVKGE